MVKNQDICWMSADELVRLIRTKRLSPVEVVKSVLDRIETVNPKINAYVTVSADSTLAEAKAAEDAVMKGDKLGPLHGVPFSVKDVNHTKGMRTTMGSKLLENFVPEEDAVNVARLKEAGAIIVGKTNTPEFAALCVTDNSVFGNTLNPWDLKRTSGGSSGGAAAAVATGLAPLATGTDMGGSIRIPSSCCGVFGIKPNFGRVPNYPPFQATVCTEGAITRTVKDAALMLDVMAGSHWGDRQSLPAPCVSFVKSMKLGAKGLKAAWSPDLGYAKVSREVRSICKEAVKKLSNTGVEVEETDLNLGDFEPLRIMHRIFTNSDLAATVSLYGQFDKVKDKLYPMVASRLGQMQSSTSVDYVRAVFARQEFSAKIGQFFEKYDVLLTPAMGVPAWKIGLPDWQYHPYDVDGKPVGELVWHFSWPFNLTGQPAASIPVGWTKDGLPVGLQIAGRYHDEATIFRVADVLEKINPWAHKKPPLE